MASISGFGQTGPWRNYMAYGPATPPLSGLSALTGYAGGPPREVGISLGDPAAGITASVGICAALVARDRTGRGQYVDVSLWEATSVLTAEGWLEQQFNGCAPPRMGNRDPWMAPHGCYRCEGEDRWVSIACASDEEWLALCGVIDSALARDSRFGSRVLRKQHEDALDAIISAWTRSRDRWEITEALQAVAVAAFPSVSCEDLARDPQLEALGFFERLEHGEVGVRQHAGIPWRLSEARNGVRAPAPLLGADTEAVLRDLMGCTPAEIARLREAEIVC
jgi:benzylsuccinate CoA-transferase BbsF subunit